MERFAKLVNRWKPLNVFSKHYVLDVRQDSEYSSAPVIVLY